LSVAGVRGRSSGDEGKGFRVDGLGQEGLALGVGGGEGQPFEEVAQIAVSTASATPLFTRMFRSTYLPFENGQFASGTNLGLGEESFGVPLKLALMVMEQVAASQLFVANYQAKVGSLKV